MNKFTIGLAGLMIASSAMALTYTRKAGDQSWANTNQWWIDSTATTLPGAEDNVILNGGKAVDLDIDATVNQVVAANGSTDGTFNINTVGRTLTTASLHAGNNTGGGTGTFSHSAGSVVVSGASTIGHATAGTGIYNLTGGDLTVSGTTTINATGTLDVNGGTLTFNNGPANLTMTGAGLLELQSGTINDTATGVGNVLTLDGNIEVSGGVMNLAGQTRLNGQMDIIGDGADVDIGFLGGTGGTLTFEASATGFGQIDSSGWINLLNVDVVIDGSAYTGGDASFVLLDAVNYANNANSITVTGLGVEGVDWEIIESTGSGAGTSSDMVLNIIPEPATLGMLVAVSGGMLFIRRRFII